MKYKLTTLTQFDPANARSFCVYVKGDRESGVFNLTEREAQFVRYRMENEERRRRKRGKNVGSSDET